MRHSLRPSHHNILTPLQREVLDVAFTGDLARESFALAGGTALTEFYFGHRLSKDLDLFGLVPDLVERFASDLRHRIPAALRGTSVSLERSGETFRRLHVTRSDDEPLQVDVGVLDLPLLSPFERVGNVNVVALDDLAVGKLMAASDRVEVRDALDLAVLADSGVDLERVRQQMLAKDAGQAANPLALVEMLGRLSRIVEKVEWPRTLVAIEPAALHAFVDQLAERFIVAIGKDAVARASAVTR